MTRRTEGSTPRAPRPGGAYSQSVRIGRLVAVSGQGGFDPTSGELVSDDAGAQAKRALVNLAEALNAVGASMDDVVRIGVFLLKPSDFAAMNQAVEDAFARPLPARTTVYVVGLNRGMQVEIDAVAVVAGEES